MKIAFLGAARTVTGSQHLISINGHKLLLDCGMYQGRGREAYERNKAFDFEPANLDAVILSHAHIDHSGNLPNLVRQGYDGPIFATHVTAHLTDILLRDSAHIQESDADVANEQPPKKQWGPPKPLYTTEDALMVTQFFQEADYNQEFEPIPGVTARLVEAGHILGSAAVVLDIKEKGKKHRIWFSGDIGRRNLPLIKDPVMPDRCDALIMETTYGDSSHGDPLEAQEALRLVLKRTLEREGKVIVPAFAVGRTQELVYQIHQLVERNEIPPVPVYVDSPLAVEASKVFLHHEQYLDSEAKNFVRKEADSDQALGFDMLTYVDTIQLSREISRSKEAMIIISASGMLESGRVVHHVRHNIENPKNTILIVSYQAPNTLGRDLLDGEERVEIQGDTYDVKAEIARINGFSAHAGQNFLREYALQVKDSAKQVFLVHGEERPAAALQEYLKDAGMDKVMYPYMRQMVEL